MDPDSTLRILLTTDNHVGFLEKDGLRGNDTFKTLEEIFFLAKQHKVDFILQGGDLFHDNRPSIRCLNEVSRLVRTYCFGDRPVNFELLSAPKETFANTAYPEVNYLDPNLNIGIPVFAIHGNHDDPSGADNVCPTDLLHTCGLVNLFGKYTSVEALEVSPILIRKGSTKFALYGIGAVREERLHRLFRDGKIKFLLPKTDKEDWFSLLVVHQNRSRHGSTGYLPETFLPSFLDIVVWGHEHDCRIDPEWNESQKFYVIQPGSSVATSLSEGEAVGKCAGLLEIRGMDFKLHKLPLCSVRSFIFEDIVLLDELSGLDPTSYETGLKVEQFCATRIQEAIDRAVGKITESLHQHSAHIGKVEEGMAVAESMRFVPPPEPLVRLRVDTSGGYERFSGLRFGQKFIGKVANPKDLIIFTNKRDSAERREVVSTVRNSSNFTPESGSSGLHAGLAINDVEQFISRFIFSNSTLQLQILTEEEMAAALRQFISGVDHEAIGTTVLKVVGQTQNHLKEFRIDERLILETILQFAISRRRKLDDAVANNNDINPQIRSNSDGNSPICDSPVTVKPPNILTEMTARAGGDLEQAKSFDVFSLEDEEEAPCGDDVSLAACNTTRSSAYPNLRSVVTDVRSRSRGARGRGSRACRRNTTHKRGRSGVAPITSSAELVCIDEESNDNSDFGPKRGRRK